MATIIVSQCCMGLFVQGLRTLNRKVAIANSRLSGDFPSPMTPTCLVWQLYAETPLSADHRVKDLREQLAALEEASSFVLLYSQCIRFI